ncbi:serine/threonine-protein kinase [Nocardiopsis aegyptia]|uniref:serine/threonine-protein kinase n=1 Tax=Nocardiopsis aegyptia TaxID=220378 RepID=UPI0036716942
MPAPERSAVDRYEIRAELGSGGMGTVWRAFDPRLRRDVAIKEVHLPHTMPRGERDAARARVLREAQAAARIAHPSVVTVHDVLEEDEQPFIVMELLGGISLQRHLDTLGPLPAGRAVHVARSILAALRAAHRMGVVHRDVKPANIMLTEDEGRVVLTDFGIAGLVDGATALTGTGMFIGTAEFMAPERFEQQRASPASDLWSLAVTLFAAVEGSSPFRRDTLTGTLAAVLTHPLPRCPPGTPLGPLVNALLHRDPVARPTPDQALALLDALVRPTAPTAPSGRTRPMPPSTPAPLPPPVADGGTTTAGPLPTTRYTAPRPAPTRVTPTTPAPAPAPTVPPRPLSGPTTGFGPRPVTMPVPVGGPPPVPGPRPGRRRGPWIAVAALGAGVLAVVVTVAIATGSLVRYETFENAYVTLSYPAGWDGRDTSGQDVGLGGGDTFQRSFEHPSEDVRIDVGTFEPGTSLLDQLLTGGEVSGWDYLTTTEDNMRGTAYADWSRIRLEREPASGGREIAHLEGTSTDTSWSVPERHTLWKTVSVSNDGSMHVLRFSVPQREHGSLAAVMDVVSASFDAR